MKSYPEELLFREMAFIAYYLHWSREEIMQLEHAERRRWCEEISRINRELNDEPPNIFDLHESGLGGRANYA